MGPLAGYTVLEMAGIGPCPYCAMMLSDMGADVIRIDRKNFRPVLGRNGALSRGRRSICIDLKKPEGRTVLLKLIRHTDVLIEGYRPGVMERLGLGPDACMDVNSKLVYGRMTGWGSTGPLSERAGHDINYIALTGALHAIGHHAGPPVPPLNLLGDFGGGGMLLAFGIVCALLESKKSDKGQVIDASMLDGCASLMAMVYGMYAEQHWHDERGVNYLDGGAHFYGVYMCKDLKWIAIGAIEPEFYKNLIQLIGADPEEFKLQNDREQWPLLRKKLEAIFIQKTRDEWQTVLAQHDTCFAPVLDLHETADHIHNKTRQVFIETDNGYQAAPAPRFSRSINDVDTDQPENGEHTIQVLTEYGWTSQELDELIGKDVIYPAQQE